MSGAESKEGSSVDKATMLRDARLARALEHAPDAHLRPDATTRAAVLAAARKAVEPAGTEVPKQGGWRSWFGASRGGRARMPWNAALASLLVAGFVTLLWRGEPVPEARMESEPAARSEEQPPASASPAVSDVAESSQIVTEAAKVPAGGPPEVPSAVPAPVPARATKPAPALKAPAAPTRAPAPAQAPVSEPSQGGEVPSSEAIERAPRAMADRAEAEDSVMGQSAQRASPASGMARRLEGERARLAQQPGAGAGAPVSHPPVSPAAPAVPQGVESRSQALPSAREAPLASALPADWTHLRRLPDGAPVTRAQAGRVVQSLATLRTHEALPQEGSLDALQRVELVRNGQILGMLTLYAQGWRYQPSNPAEAERAGPLDATAAARLSEELAGLASAR